MKKFIPLLCSVLVLSACTATTGSAPGEGAHQAISAQTPTNEAQARAKIHFELGSAYLLNGNTAAALDEARIALSSDTGYAPAYNLLGLTHMSMGEPKLAEENFERALRLAPGDPEINNNFGWFLCQNNREQRAIAYFNAAARNPLYATPVKPLTNAGICSIKIKDDKAGEEYLLRALRMNPNNAQALYWLSDLAYRQSRFIEARQWISDLEKNMEPTAETLWLALRIERKLGNREAEARHASQLRRRFATSPEFRLLAQGQYP